jgi:hypothetical protein
MLLHKFYKHQWSNVQCYEPIVCYVHCTLECLMYRMNDGLLLHITRVHTMKQAQFGKIGDAPRVSSCSLADGHVACWQSQLLSAFNDLQHSHFLLRGEVCKSPPVQLSKHEDSCSTCSCPGSWRCLWGQHPCEPAAPSTRW